MIGNPLDLRSRLSALFAAIAIIVGVGVLGWAILTGRIGFRAATGQTIVLSPASTTVTVNQTFPVTIQVNTNNLNTVVGSAEVRYTPTDLALESWTPTGDATSGTVYQYLVNASNNASTGTFTITRGDPGDGQTNDTDDGFTGQNGTLVTLTFRALRQVTSTAITITQANSALIADDKNGTNELDSVANASVSITGFDTPTLSVSLIANPATGTAPLNDVDLIADVSGTATGTIRYRFDCINNGTYEHDVTNSTDPYTIANLCDYASAGTYTAKVVVDRQGVSANNTATITVTTPPAPTFSVSLSANPSTGSAPLNDVDFTADISGTATGTIRYRFDCTNDGSYEHDVTNSTDPYTVANLCDYANAGTYTAKVLVDRQGVSASNTVTITVSTTPTPPPPSPPPPTPPSTPPTTQGCIPSNNPDDYHYVWVRQNGYPTIDWGQAYRFEVTVRNTGNATWCQGTINLGTDRARDRVPGFEREGDGPSGWTAPNRVQLVESSVAPGQEGTFAFWMRVPQGKTPGTYREYFRPVADGVTWMEDYGIYWDVLVPSLADAYHGRWVAQNGYPTLRRGQSYTFEVKFQNTGVRTWEKGIVNLGTDRPRDVVYNWIRGDGWTSSNRVGLVESSVAPGAIGTYRFSRTVPDNKAFGCYRDYFRQVADGITWMDDWGVYWDICVVP